MTSEVSSSGATHVVELTPVGRGAVAVVLVAGPCALNVVNELFHSVRGQPLTEIPVGQIALGSWGAADGEELIACRRAENQLEIHCHGGLAAVRGVINQLTDRGCLKTTWQDWLRRQAADPLCAAAQIALASAPTARTAAILLDQYEGALSRVIHAALVNVSAGRWEQAAQSLDEILVFRDFGTHLTSPWQVVLTGRTNVGKSSLLNALAGYQRAIVSPHSGTTRDILTVTTAIDGWPVQLLDTAGMRDTEDELEAAGVALASVAIAKADLVLHVDDTAIFSLPVSTAARLIHVRSKWDLDSTRVAHALECPTSEERTVFFTSSLTGEGIAVLVTAIGRALVPNIPGNGSAVPFQANQVAAIVLARSAVDSREQSTATAALRSLLAD